MSFPYLCSSSLLLLFLQNALGEVSVSSSTVLPELLEDSGGTPGLFNGSAISNDTGGGLEVLIGNLSMKDEGVNATVEDSLEDLGGLLVDSRLGLEELEGFFRSIDLNQTEGPMSSNSSIKLMEELKDIFDISGNVTDASSVLNETLTSGIFSNLMDVVEVRGNSTDEGEPTNATSY